MLNTKEVRFDIYCPKCKYYENKESEDPCWDCLNQGWNEESHKPIYYAEGETTDANTAKNKTASRDIQRTVSKHD